MNFVLIQPKIFEFCSILKAVDVGDSAVDESEGLDAFEPVDDGHVSEILEDKFNAFYFVDLLPLVVFETVHFFLRLEEMLQ